MKPTIIPSKLYSLQEIIQEEFVPGVNTHTKIYNLITKRIRIPDEGYKYKRIPARRTNRIHIAPIDTGKVQKKISGKMFVKGSEIIMYLQLNHII